MRKQLILGLSLILLGACGGGSGPEHDKMMAEHKAMLSADSAQQAMRAAREEGIRAIFTMFESGNSDGIEQYVDANVVEHTPPPGMEGNGIDYMKQMVAMQHAGFPDAKMSVISIAHNDDMMMVHYNMKGTNTGDMGPEMKATGKAMDVNGVDIIKFNSDNKATDHWGYWEESTMMQQLGMMPGPEAAAKK